MVKSVEVKLNYNQATFYVRVCNYWPWLNLSTKPQRAIHVYLSVQGNAFKVGNRKELKEGCFHIPILTRRKFLKKFHFKKGWNDEKDRNKAGMRKLNNTTLVPNDGGLLSGLQFNALTSLVHFAHNKVN